MASEKTTSTNQHSALGSVLVIGGCGFLGHHVVRLLLRDWETSHIAVVDLTTTRNRRPDSDGVEYIDADITDNDKLLKIFGRIKPDVVIHTASPAPHSNSVNPNALKKVFYKVNVEGTKSVIAASQQAGVPALIYTSSASIISDNKTDLINANETWPVIRGKAQTEYYSETKAEAEASVLAANRQEGYKLLTASIRPAGIFGEGDLQNLYHVINAWEEGKTGVQVGPNHNLFDFSYVENIAHAHLLAARALLVTATNPQLVPLDHERVDGEAFFITNGQPVPFWDFTRAVWRAAGSDKGVNHVWTLPRDLGLVLGFAFEVIAAITRRPPTLNRQRIVFSTMTRYYDISKARRRLGYEPLVSLPEGIKRGVDWTMEQKRKRAAEGQAQKA